MEMLIMVDLNIGWLSDEGLVVGQWREPPALSLSKRQKKQDRKEEQCFSKFLPSLLLFYVARNNVSATNLA
mgnify:CR=1 FL=1